MGVPNIPFYGNTDIGSALEDVEKVIDKIKTNKYDKEDLIKLFNANNELLKAILEDENED